VFYSFEMSRDSILKRLVCLRTPVRYQQIIRGDLNLVERRYVTDALQWLDSIPLRIIGASGRTVLAIRSHADRLARRGKCVLIAVDYIGLIRASDVGENRNKQLGEICRQLKGLAVELSIPAIVLAQLSRASEARNDKRPQLSDLRDSGELEEHADLVALLHRPGYYDRKNPDIQLAAEFIVAKQRNGDTPVIQLEFHRQNGRFTDPEDHNDGQRETRLFA
jgi:replicative DNA helicase